MGKRVIRLTESDLIRLVKRVINEDAGVSYAKDVWNCMKKQTFIKWDSNSHVDKPGEKYLLDMVGYFDVKIDTGGKVTHRIDITSSDGINFHSVKFNEKGVVMRDTVRDTKIQGKFDCKKFLDSSFYES